MRPALSLQGDKEIVGTLRGFDEYVNMVLDDVIEYEITATGRKEVCDFSSVSLFYFLYVSNFSSQTPLDQILLNGANICMMVPGGDPNSVEA